MRRSSAVAFRLQLGAALAALLAYGWFRFQLGVDFTDEGGHLAWPLRVHLGEAPHAAEVLTLLRPIEVHLALIQDVAPNLTLHGMRMFGWTLHLAAFAALATFLFRLGAPPLRAVLTAAIPVFVCHLLGVATPSYNTLASDGLTLALSGFGLLALGPPRATATAIMTGLALFVATLAHPGLGVAALLLVGWQLTRGGLIANLRRRAPTPTNLAVLVFLGAGIAYAVYFVAGGHFARWWERVPLALDVASRREPLPSFLPHLLQYLLAFHPFAAPGALALLLAAAAARLARQSRHEETLRQGTGFLALLALLLVFRFDTPNLPLAFILVTLVLAVVHLAPPWPADPAGAAVVPLLVLAAVAGTLALAAMTYFYAFSRSWAAGLQVLPFAFATAFTLTTGPAARRGLWTLLLPALLALVTLAAARNHYREIYRDGPPDTLVDGFTVPKLAGVRSTPERVAAVNALYAALRDEVRPGDSLLVYDDAPLVYFLFGARPAYGMAWAVRYAQSPATLNRLAQEFAAGPLPRYAIRLRVDPSEVEWRDAPRRRYDGYPLNAVVLAQYELVQTIHPFEIWRRKAP